MKYEFWKDWKRKTKLEESAIKSVKVGKKIILNEIPHSQLIAIYLKGSFVRREMNRKSDVDFLVIVKDSKFVDKLEKVHNRYRNNFNPDIGISGYSIWELKTGNLVKTPSRKSLGRAGPRRIKSHLSDFKLIYGESINQDTVKGRSEEDIFRITIDVFKKVFIPNYEVGKIGFQDIVKQVFWLTRSELIVKGKTPSKRWSGMVKQVGEFHILKEAWYHRKNFTNGKKQRGDFIRKLKRHLDKLGKEIK